MKNIILSNGHLMPILGVSTNTLSLNETEEMIRIALNLGYRHIETANIFQNEKALLKVLKETSVKRKDLFISSKLWPSEYKNEDSIKQMLDRIGVEYLDLVFLHYPVGNFYKAYKMLEKAYKEKIIKAIGLSGFSSDEVLNIIEKVEIKPHVVQLEIHPYYYPTKMLNALRSYDIHLMSSLPIPSSKDLNIFNEEPVIKLSNKLFKEASQIVLRWHIDNNHIICMASNNPTKLVEYFQVFDFALKDEEIKTINKLNKKEPLISINEEFLFKVSYTFPDYHIDKYHMH